MITAQACEDISKNLQSIKVLLHGEIGKPTLILHRLTAAYSVSQEPQPELVAQLAQETYNSDLLLLLVSHIAHFEFEARKDVVQIFNNLLRRQIGSRSPTVEYLAARPDIIFATLAGYENEDVALNTGMIIKEMLRHEQLCKILLYSEQ